MLQVHTYPRENLDPDLLHDALIEKLPGFRSVMPDKSEAGTSIARDDNGRVDFTESEIRVTLDGSINPLLLNTIIESLS